MDINFSDPDRTLRSDHSAKNKNVSAYVCPQTATDSGLLRKILMARKNHLYCPVIQSFSKRLYPYCLRPKFSPSSLQILYQVDLLNSSFGELQNCEEVLSSMQIFQDKADTVEEGTRCQTPSNLWFPFEQNFGCKHEYVAFMHCEELESVKLTNIGLFIYTSCLHHGARPETSVSCSCHGLGVVYIERPIS